MAPLSPTVARWELMLRIRRRRLEFDVGAPVIAKELGFLDLNAAGAGDDTPDLALKRKLGYVIEPAWITFTKAL